MIISPWKGYITLPNWNEPKVDTGQLLECAVAASSSVWRTQREHVGLQAFATGCT